MNLEIDLCLCTKGCGTECSAWWWWDNLGLQGRKRRPAQFFGFMTPKSQLLCPCPAIFVCLFRLLWGYDEPQVGHPNDQPPVMWCHTAWHEGSAAAHTVERPGAPATCRFWAKWRRLIYCQVVPARFVHWERKGDMWNSKEGCGGAWACAGDCSFKRHLLTRGTETWREGLRWVNGEVEVNPPTSPPSLSAAACGHQSISCCKSLITPIYLSSSPPLLVASRAGKQPLLPPGGYGKMGGWSWTGVGGGGFQCSEPETWTQLEIWGEADM